METSEKAMLKEVNKGNVDTEGRYIRKMGKLHFGYKRHTVTEENGLVVLAWETILANESDIKHLETPLRKGRFARGPLYADKGYDSAENKEVLKRMKLKKRIIHKATKEHGISERKKRVNVAINKVRYKVERPFGSMHR